MRASLKFKLSFAVAALAVTLGALAGWLQREHMSQDYLQLIEGQQQSLTIATADALAEKLQMQLRLLQRSAETLRAAPLGSAAAAQAALQPLAPAQTLFSSLYLVGRDGHLIGGQVGGTVPAGVDLSDREYFRIALDAGEANISAPLISRVSGRPAVLMAAPVMGAEGSVRAVLVGSLDLQNPNALGALSHAKVGKTGYFAVVTRGANPVYVMHPEPARVLSPARPLETTRSTAPLAASPAARGAVATSGGGDAIVTRHYIKSVNWEVQALLPAAEALAPLQQARAAQLRETMVLALCFAALVWACTWWLLRPLGALGRTMRALREGSTRLPGRTLRRRDDEIGDVTREFVGLMQQLRSGTAELEAANRALQHSEERVRSILTHAPDAFVGISVEGRINAWNQRAEATFGWSAAEAIGRDFDELLIPPAQRPARADCLAVLRGAGEGPARCERYEITTLHRDGHEIPVELSLASVTQGDSHVSLAFLHDISERRQAQQLLADKERRLRAITDNLPVLIGYIDRDRRYAFTNETYRRWLGVPPESMLGRKVEDAIGCELYEERRQHLEGALAGERASFETHSVLGGVPRYLRIDYVPDVDADGQVAGVYTLSTDITGQKEVEARLSQLARSDTLTGLPNRYEFERRLQEAMARCRRTLQPMALLYLDVDKFKSINDSLGHAAGDEVLKEFAQRLKAALRGTDTVARLSGDEFVIVLEGLRGRDESQFVARKIVGTVRKPFDVQGRELEVTTSIGIALYEGGPLPEQELLARADEALYVAKKAGRDRFHVAG
ncbi:diguanylate cyclase [Aquabacterium sp. A7-Y]|uniref:diguanylate cyclase domain-containing protein n=1 Tax=Aquabacterium sp. A7-Y TaxID=1349605 RepID=UPI00223D98F9|nr:diguanylate cyclase [Aquabacterium sp. A7-Y]MCW7537610.1 diguanylate cyclase [Aquabacterium sp. A7-Y]